MLLDPNGERPARTRRVGKWRFKLAGVVPGWRNAREHVDSLYDGAGMRRSHSDSIKPSFGDPPKWAICGATDSQVAGWIELQSYRDWQKTGECYAASEKNRPYLIWERTD